MKGAAPANPAPPMSIVAVFACAANPE